MIAILQFDRLSDNPERLVGLLGILLLCGGGIWMLVRWFRDAPMQPDPWDAKVEAELASEKAAPMCHRCLCPHHEAEYFCPECGAPVGTYTNWLPFPYLFSIGHTLRIGTDGTYRHSPLIIAGFLLFSWLEYGEYFPLFVPVYWFVFLKRLWQHPTSAPSSNPPPSAPVQGAANSPL
jgi:hypothetical protein